MRRRSDSERDTLVDSLEADATVDPRRACLIVMYGDELGRRVTLDPKGATLLGRDAACHVPLDDETVSREHASIVYSEGALGIADGAFRVRDLGSTNGVHVNFRRVAEQALADGDLLKVGRTVFKFLHSGQIESRYHEAIHELMIHDGLTRAYNRRHFDQELSRELGRAERYRRSLALVLFDIDHFKHINDARGHLIGDEVLRRLADMVQARMRREDLLARIGGEEFAVILPESNVAGAEVLAERLRALVAAADVSIDGERVPLTCSFGCAAATPDRGTTPRDVIARADGALYAAKAAGRNCVRTA